MDNNISRINMCGRRWMVTSPIAEVNGCKNFVTCTDPSTSFVRVNGANNQCKITAGNPRITVRANGNNVRTSNGTSARDVITSGCSNTILIDNNAGDIDMAGHCLRVRVRENAGHIRVSGNAAKLAVFGDVRSITVLGENHSIYIQGNCTGNIWIGENGLNKATTKRNRILILGSTTGTLNIYESGYRNQVTTTTVETINVDGDENWLRANCDDVTTNTETENLIGPEVDCDSTYATPDRDTVNHFNNGHGVHIPYMNNPTGHWCHQGQSPSY